MTPERLAGLGARGWRLTRDGSTATAHFAWDDPDDPDSGWELLVLHTAGHGARFTLNAFESGLTERAPADADRLAEALSDARELLNGWQGELPEEGG
jgi:hypothetical protein